MNKLIKGFVAIAMASSVISTAYAKDEGLVTAADMRAVPELQEISQNMSTSASASMRCMVDTPAWDNWGSPTCFSSGSARNATAYFNIQNAPSNYTVYWSRGSCSTSSTSCAVSISAGNSINMTANVLDHSNNTFSSVSATAYYEDYR